MNNAARKDAPDYAALAKQLEELNAKATGAPWSWADWTEDDGPNLQTLEAPPNCRPDGPSDLFPNLCYRILSADEPIERPADRDLITTLRNNLPTLLAALEAAQQVQKLQSEMKRFKAEGVPVVIRDLIVERLDAKVEKLTKALGEIRSIIGSMRDRQDVRILMVIDKAEALSAIEEES